MTRKKPTGSPAGGKSLTAFLTRWRILTEAVQDHLGEMPYAAAPAVRLEKLAGEIQKSLAEEKTLAARQRALVRRRRGAMLQAHDLRNRLAAAVMGQYGVRSEKLREFGLKPRRRQSRPAPEGGARQAG